MKHNVIYVFFFILVDDVYCVAIHDLSPVLTALFSIELGGFNKDSCHFVKKIGEWCSFSCEKESSNLFFFELLKKYKYI